MRIVGTPYQNMLPDLFQAGTFLSIGEIPAHDDMSVVRGKRDNEWVSWMVIVEEEEVGMFLKSESLETICAYVLTVVMGSVVGSTRSQGPTAIPSEIQGSNLVVKKPGNSSLS